MLPKFSLRAHKAPLTCIVHHQDKLVSSDRDGWVIIWNLASRRPIALWRAHEGHVLTLKLTSIGLISHGRDSMIRIWNTESKEIEKCSRNGLDICAVGTKQGSELPKPSHAEIPVNALNFCNVDFCEGLLITPATVDSENFDIYEVNDPFGSFHFKRVLQNVSSQNVRTSENVIEEINVPDETGKRGGHGIIMRTLFVRRDLFFVGYESGAVCGFRLEHANRDTSFEKDRVVLFKDYKPTVVFSRTDHKPLPILSIEIDAKNLQLLTGSASKKLIIYDIRHLLEENSPQTHQDDDPIPVSRNLRHYGIQCVAATDGIILAGFWDGIIKGYTRDFEEIMRLERKEEAIKPEGDDNSSRPAKKSLCMSVWTARQLGSNEGRVASRKITFRNSVVGQEPLLFVGYGDGLISAFLGIY